MPDNDHPPAFILTGEPGSGKTTFLLQLIEELKGEAVSLAGFAAVSVPSVGPSKDYHILDLASGKTLPLASRRQTAGWEPTGIFFFNPEALHMGINILNGPQSMDCDLFIVDEIGPFELQGKIWAESLTRLLSKRSGCILMVVRTALVEKVLENWHIEGAAIIDIRHTKPEFALAGILSEIGRDEGRINLH